MHQPILHLHLSIALPLQDREIVDLYIRKIYCGQHLHLFSFQCNCQCYDIDLFLLWHQSSLDDHSVSEPHLEVQMQHFHL